MSKITQNNLRFVGIVIVHFNCFFDTLRCLRSLYELNSKNHEIIIIDNCSTDGSGKKLAEEIKNKKVSIILNEDNKGFAAACNQGIELFSQRDFQYVWLLNPDTEVDRFSLNALVEVISSRSCCAAVGSKVYYADNGHRTSRLWSAGGVVNFSDQQIFMLQNNELDVGQSDDVRDCDYLPGCSILLSLAAVAEIGYLDESFFMYFEETDWCVRAMKCGYQLLFVPRSVVWHHFSDSKMQEARTVYYYNRNEKFFWFKYSSLRKKVFLCLSTLFIKLPQSIWAWLNATDAESKNLFVSHIMSCVDFLRGRRGNRR